MGNRDVNEASDSAAQYNQLVLSIRAEGIYEACFRITVSGVHVFAK
jgi:hypothetical protein